MAAAEPAETPYTVPVVFTLAIVDALLLHVPPGTKFEKRVVEPPHTAATPEIVPAFGNGFTVIGLALSEP
jgi:hypothetical protein